MNSTSLLIFLAVLPIILILVLVYTKDHTREPIKLLFSLFILGILSCVLVLLISEGTSYLFPMFGKNLLDEGFLGVLVYSFFRVALIEELCKWIVLYIGGYKNKEFDETFDIIVYSVFISLGFAFLENILFIMNSEKIGSILLRALLSVPGHACFGIFMGYYLGMAKIDKNKRIENYILSILIPVSIHGIFDFCLMSKIAILVVVFLIFIVIIYILSIYRLNIASKQNTRICNECGSRIKGRICHSCGARQE